MAVAVAPRDKQRAWSLIDRSMAAFAAPAAERRGYLGYGGYPAQAALLAVHAQRVEYPDLERLVWQVLALRPTNQQDDSPARVVESQVVMALFLALVDPDIARQMLEDLQPRSELVGAGCRRDRPRAMGKCLGTGRYPAGAGDRGAGDRGAEGAVGRIPVGLRRFGDVPLVASAR
jgi:hypothetical protein